MTTSIVLRGGPFDGADAGGLGLTFGAPLLCEGTDVPEGMVARYKPARNEPGFYDFDGYDKIVAKLPFPGSEDGARRLAGKRGKQ